MKVSLRQALFVATALAAVAGGFAAYAPTRVLASSGPGSDGSGGDKVDDQIEDQVDDQAEAEVEDQTEAQVEDKTEDQVEDKTEDQVEDKTEDQVEDKTEDQVEDKTEDHVEDKTEDQVEDKTEDKAEDKAEDSVESDVEDSVENDIEDSAQDGAERNIEDHIERRIEDDVADNRGPGNSGDAGAEQKIDDSIDAAIADTSGSGPDSFDLAEEQAKLDYDAAIAAADADYDAAREAAKLSFEESLAQPDADKEALKIEYDQELAAAEATHDASRESADTTYASSMLEIKTAEDASTEGGSGSSESETSINSGPGSTNDNSGSGDDAFADDSHSGSDSPNSGPGGGEDQYAENGDSSENSGSDDGKSSGEHKDGENDNSGKGSSNSGSSGDSGRSAADGRETFEVAYDDDGNEIERGEWLVMAPTDAIDALTKEGYVAKQIEPLDGLGLALVRLQAPASLTLAQAEATIHAAAPEAEVDFNHVYHPNTASMPEAAPGLEPGAAMVMPRGESGRGHAIGVIDTSVDLAHPALKSARIRLQSFVDYDNREPTDHGTSVVSILAGAAPDYHGLLPDAEVYAASVFFEAPGGGEAATTFGLVRALDWMTSNGVAIVNMSLTGPDNAILHAAINRAYDKGTMVVAAVGNDGPAAPPLYPAGYDHVVGVTAVSRSKKIWRLANRGDYVDFSAPGVDILHAAGSSGFSASSGTSMASPFVAAAFAIAVRQGERMNDDSLDQFARNAEDLGAKGFDPIYGYGLIRPLKK